MMKLKEINPLAAHVLAVQLNVSDDSLTIGGGDGNPIIFCDEIPEWCQHIDASLIGQAWDAALQCWVGPMTGHQRYAV